jgi:tellurite methyltransferase
MSSIPGDRSSAAPKGTLLKKAADFAAEQDWSGYFGVVVGKPARDTLVQALELFDREPRGGSAGFAVDLGCGEGRDTLELLRRGWRVLAIDSHPEAFEHLRPRVEGDARLRLEMLATPFSQVGIPRADLVNASYSLPFCEPEVFPVLWRKIVAAVRPGGRFAGQFFGDRDDWARCGDRLHMTRAQVEACLGEFELEVFKEEEKDEAMADGTVKHWHVFHVVGRRVSSEQ